MATVDTGNAVILFVVISSLLIAVVSGVMHFRGVNIWDTKLQNKIIAIVGGPCLVILVSVMDVSITSKIFIFGASALAGVAYLKSTDIIRAIIYGRNKQDPEDLNKKNNESEQEQK